VSSLEALHDEIYFDTLDFLRGITDIDVDEGEQPDDSQRFSAPGNVFPVIHASTEGEAPRVKVTFEDWAGAAPLLTLTWKEVGREENIRKIAFPVLKSKPVQIPALVYNGLEEKLESLSVELDFDKEGDYLAFLDLLPAYRELVGKDALPSALSYPALSCLRLKLKCGESAQGGSPARRGPAGGQTRARPGAPPPRREHRRHDPSPVARERRRADRPAGPIPHPADVDRWTVLRRPERSGHRSL